MLIEIFCFCLKAWLAISPSILTNFEFMQVDLDQIRNPNALKCPESDLHIVIFSFCHRAKDFFLRLIFNFIVSNQSLILYTKFNC